MEKLVREYADNGKSVNFIAQALNITYTQARYLCIKHNIKTTGQRNSIWTKDNIEKAIVEAECKSDVLRNLNMSTKSGNFQTLDKYCRRFNIDISNLKITTRGNKFKLKYTTLDILSGNTTDYSRTCLKKRILKDKILEEVCGICGINNTWNGLELRLQLDHINGVNNDNRIENLRFLCPNCHSQTSTFAGKNKK